MATATEEKVDSKGKLKAEELKRMRTEDHKKVKGIFRCFEPQGGSVTFSYKKYKEDPVQTYTMVDGSIYTVPYMVAKHLNQNCAYPVHSYSVDANGNQIPIIGKRVNRCSFESLEFAAPGLDS